MKVLLAFGAGLITGSVITYCYIMRKNVEIPEETYEIVESLESKKEEEEVEKKEESKVEHMDYTNLVSNLYSPKYTEEDHELRPYLITEEAFGLYYKGFDKVTLQYYELDGTLANDDYIFEDIDYSIGIDNLKAFGTDSDEADVIFVRNERAGVDYRIEAVKKSYEDAYPQEFEENEWTETY